MIRRNHNTIARAIDAHTPYVIGVQLPAWYEDAICSQTDPESFYPVKGRGKTSNVKVAKQVCAKCPVIGECLTYAVETQEAWGVWGGKTAFERRKMKRPAA